MKILFVFVLVFVVAGSAFSQEGWYRQNSGTSVYLWRPQFFSPTNGWITAWSDNAFRTTNGGTNWTPVFPPEGYRCIGFMNDSIGFAIGPALDNSHQKLLIRTTDYGSTWSEPYQYDIDGDITNEDMASIGDTVFLMHQVLTLRSTNAGQSWMLKAAPIFDQGGIAFINSKIGVVVGDHSSLNWPDGAGFGYTTNGGENWIETYIPVKSNIGLRDVAFLPNGKLFAVSCGRTLMVAEHFDGYKTKWDTIPKLVNDNDCFASVVFCDSNNGLVTGANAFIYRTTDGGRSWKFQDTDYNFPDDTNINYGLRTFMLDSLNAWAVSDYGLILHTSDAGKSWVRQYLPTLESLHSQVYPQPFATKATIGYELPKAVKVTLRIYDGLGRELQTTTSPGIEDAGWHSVEFDGSAYSDEVFYYRIEAYPYVGTGKFTKVAF